MGGKIMELRIDHNYYITDYKQMNEYMIEFMRLVKDKKIVKIISSSGLCGMKDQNLVEKCMIQMHKII